MDTSTNTKDAPRDDASAEGRLFTRLVFLRNADDPGQPSALHALDEIDEVRFRRGARDVERSGRALTLALPDARMSSDHGRLVRHGPIWMVDDPGSKNGTFVDGALVRRTLAGDGAVLELGRSYFLLRCSRAAAVPARLTGDLAARELPPWPAELATFEPGLAHAFDQVARLAPSAVSIVVLGETGTGKERLARAVHALSGRAGELVAVNCGALPAALIESELFGHRKGAFSGATADRRGLVRSADRGTLFLDEIGELPPASQPAFLRVLQEQAVLPVGEDRPVAVDLRVISATLRDLDEAVVTGRFRADLHARIAGYTVALPPLRARREDLGLLLDALLRALAPDRAIRFAPLALRALLRYGWPQNIRELQKALETALALAPGDAIELEHLPAHVQAPPGPARAGSATAPPPLALDEADRELRDRLVALLTEHQGNVATVAGALGKQRQQIYKWVKRLGIDLDGFRRPPG